MINRFKGYDFLLESIGQIPSSERPPLVVVSNMRDDSEARYLEGVADECGVEVDFRTMISDQELVRLYNRAGCVAYSPIMESFGLVPLEAMACATPVVGICEGGVRETVIHNETGLLVGRDPAAFGEAIRLMLADRRWAGELGKRGREVVEERWTWETAIVKLERMLEKASKE